MAEVRLLLADDSQVLLDALTELVDRAPGITVVAAVRDGAAALARTLELRPDVAVVDVRMPGGGPDLVRSLLGALPGLHVIGLSSQRGGGVPQEMAAAGAARYLAKGDPDLDLIGVIHDVTA